MMKLHQHVLAGCSPVPLAYYLKALGILRLIALQKDSQCRGAWVNDQFILLTSLSKEALELFFLEEYVPTSIVSPWNADSGFYKISAKNPLIILQSSQSSRFAAYRETIAVARQQLEKLTGSKNPSSPPKEELKNAFIQQCRMEFRSSALDWLNAAVVLDEHGEPKYPSLFGTGGNDERLDFTNNFMQRLMKLFDVNTGKPQSVSHDLLRSCLYKTPSNQMANVKIGQFFPGSAGGANSSTGPKGDSLVNLWDFVLMLEGAVVFNAGATKRLHTQSGAQASAPFALYNQAVGFLALSELEESAQGEQWMPIWHRFLSFIEVKSLFSEGRAQIGRNIAVRPIDMARAVARLGVSRGIESFQRYGFLKRNGRANFAVPLERVAVRQRPNSKLIDELTPWLERLNRRARDNAPARLIRVERNLSNAVFAVLTHDAPPRFWQDILLAAVAVEEMQVTGLAYEIQPIPKLSPEWIWVCLGTHPGPEERLAVALGSAALNYDHFGHPVDSIRNHWLPLRQGRYKMTDKKLAHDVRVVARGRDSISDLMEILMRRLQEASEHNIRHPRLVSAPGATAFMSDLVAWINGSVDVERCVRLARAFMAVDWKKWIVRNWRLSLPQQEWEFPDDSWCVMRLNTLPWSLGDGLDIPCDPAIIRRLQVGDGRTAFQMANRRLRSHGIWTTIEDCIIDSDMSRRYGSAMAFPISYQDARRLLQIIQPQKKEA